MRAFVLVYTLSTSGVKDVDVTVGVFSSPEGVFNSIGQLRTVLQEDYPDLSYLRFSVFSCRVDGIEREKVYSEYKYFYSDGDSESGCFGKVEHPI